MPVIRRCIAKGLSTADTKIGSIASSPLITIGPDATLREAMDLMAAKDIRRLFVVEKGRIVGRVTLTEAFQNALTVMRLLSSITTHAVADARRQRRGIRRGCGRTLWGPPRRLHVNSSRICGASNCVCGREAASRSSARFRRTPRTELVVHDHPEPPFCELDYPGHRGLARPRPAVNRQHRPLFPDSPKLL